jgi:hypothetical protein
MAFFFDQLRRLFHAARGGSIEFDLGPYRGLLARIKDREYEGAGDDELGRVSGDLRGRVLNGDGGDELVEEIVEWFRSAEITRDGVSLPDDRIDGPASTWTYLVNDNPFGTWLERAARGIKRKLTGR